jgi:cobalt/nickel transport system permease protein
MLKVPKIFVLQLLLTYRYISVLIEELSRMMRAYTLRAPEQKGIHRSVWGSFAGQLILRTYDRAQRVYTAMSLRGFLGEYHTGKIPKLGVMDFTYLAGWISFFVIARIFNIPLLLELLFTGVIK